MSKISHNSVSQALQPGEDCPALDQLIERLSAKDPATETHLATCAHCSTEMALYRQFQEPTIRPEERADIDALVSRLRQNSPLPKAAGWKSFWTFQWMVPASLALAAILVGSFLWAPGRTANAPLISGSDDAMRSGKLDVVGPTGDLPDVPAKLQWKSIKGAVHYRLSLDEVDRTPVWSTSVEGAEAPLPADVRLKIVPLKTFTWNVSALDSTGAVIADSGNQRFRLAKRSN